MTTPCQIAAFGTAPHVTGIVYSGSVSTWHQTPIHHPCDHHPSRGPLFAQSRGRQRPFTLLQFSSSRDDHPRNDDDETLRRDLSRLESLEEILAELEEGVDGVTNNDEDLDESTVLESGFLDEEAWIDLFGALPDEADMEEVEEMEMMANEQQNTQEDKTIDRKATNLEKIPTESLESALLQGVVPADAGVGGDSLPGDYGFDPLDLASKDIIGKTQRWIWNLLPGPENEKHSLEERPQALVLRDYREAEIRNGRLAMLAAVFWPLQEMLDRLLLEDYQFGSTTMVYGGVTLPYFPLLMTAIMLLLGYLDIYANAIKDVDAVGEAFLPGDCFWDPLRMLDGAPSTMKRNMQERELTNGRMAMLAFAVFLFEEATTHQPLITIPGNELLFEPAYQVPYIQEWLDSIFATPSSTLTAPDVGVGDLTESVKEALTGEQGL